MNLNEMWSKTASAYQDISADNSKTKLKSLRSTRLTLAQIKKLRQLNDIRNLEQKEKLTKVRKQYAPPADSGGMG